MQPGGIYHTMKEEQSNPSGDVEILKVKQEKRRS
jgi:hypothetical protein